MVMHLVSVNEARICVFHSTLNGSITLTQSVSPSAYGSKKEGRSTSHTLATSDSTLVDMCLPFYV